MFVVLMMFGVVGSNDCSDGNCCGSGSSGTSSSQSGTLDGCEWAFAETWVIAVSWF